MLHSLIRLLLRFNLDAQMLPELWGLMPVVRNAYRSCIRQEPGWIYPPAEIRRSLLKIDVSLVFGSTHQHRLSVPALRAKQLSYYQSSAQQ